MKLKAVSLSAIALAAAVLVAACGGGGGSSPAEDAAPVAGVEVGVLTDSPIGGVEYRTSGGYTGFTDANGNYNYNPGETVEFRIGGISLGTVPATGTVTPIQLAGNGADAANRVVNLLVLLQSLDADGDPSNGITIAEAARTAASNVGSLDLGADPATFSGASTLTSLLSSAGVSTTPVSHEDALAHFKTQFLSQLAGGWVYATDEEVVVIRFAADGSYLLGEDAAPDGDGHPGVERGKIDWDPVTGAIQLVGTPAVDTNGEWGLSDLRGEVIHLDGDKLVVTDPDGTVTTFTRIPRSETNPLAGIWSLGTSKTDASKQHFVFFPSGKYMMLDPIGDEDPSPCGGPGIERGTYTFDPATGAFAVEGAGKIDGNGCAGLRDGADNASFTFPVDQIATGSFSFDAGGDTVTFTRVGP